MAGKQLAGDGLPANIAGMSKNQLYDIMSQMKNLIEQNQQQAKQILIQNPLLTKALFQAQIMLGIVRPPQVIPSIQPPISHNSQHSTQPTQQPSTQAAPSLPGQVGLQDQTGPSQVQAPPRKQYQNQPAMPSSSAGAPSINVHSQPMASRPMQDLKQPKGHLNPQMTPTSLPQSSQLPNMPAHPLHSFSQPPSLHQTQMPAASGQLQQSLQTSGVSHMPLQPPLPPQPRPPSMPNFHHQYPQQMGPNMGYQHAPPQHLSQSMFHSGTKPPVSSGPSFPQGQPPPPSQPPPQSMYQGGGTHLGSEFNNQAGSSMQVDRGSWMSSPPESSTVPQLSGPPPSVPGQMGPGSQPPRPPALSPEMEKALLQQVMSLTPEQINLLPPERRSQVLQPTATADIAPINPREFFSRKEGQRLTSNFSRKYEQWPEVDARVLQQLRVVIVSFEICCRLLGKFSYLRILGLDYL